jgi:hypothetical protein
MSTATRDFRERTRERFPEAPELDTTPTLLRRLLTDVGVLFGQELALLKAETSRSVADMRAATVSMAIGGAVLMAGFIFLLLSAVYALSEVVAPWLAALIVGGAVTLIGALMLATGRRKLQPASLAPRRTAEALRKDTQMVKGASHHEQR